MLPVPKASFPRGLGTRRYRSRKMSWRVSDVTTKFIRREITCKRTRRRLSTSEKKLNHSLGDLGWLPSSSKCERLRESPTVDFLFGLLGNLSQAPQYIFISISGNRCTWKRAFSGVSKSFLFCVSNWRCYSGLVECISTRVLEQWFISAHFVFLFCECVCPLFAIAYSMIICFSRRSINSIKRKICERMGLSIMSWHYLSLSIIPKRYFCFLSLLSWHRLLSLKCCGIWCSGLSLTSTLPQLYHFTAYYSRGPGQTCQTNFSTK